MNTTENNPHLSVVRESTTGFYGSKYMLLIVITLAIVAIDQFTKILVHSSFDLGESIVVIKNYFNLTYVRNVGAAFGIFGKMPAPFRQVFFLTVPPLAVFFIVMILRTTHDSEKLQIYALSLISGGAVGNYIDRLRFGYVIDFLDFHWQEKISWPAFNIADIVIVTGVGISFLFVFKPNKPPSSTENKP